MDESTLIREQDGILGVCAGVEMLRVLNEGKIETRFPVGVINWTNEEGARFPISMVSSGVWAGKIPLEKAYSLQEVGDGKQTMKQELERIGYMGATESSFRAIPIAVSSIASNLFDESKAECNGRHTLNYISVRANFIVFVYIPKAISLKNNIKSSSTLVLNINTQSAKTVHANSSTDRTRSSSRKPGAQNWGGSWCKLRVSGIANQPIDFLHVGPSLSLVHYTGQRPRMSYWHNGFC